MLSLGSTRTTRRLFAAGAALAAASLPLVGATAGQALAAPERAPSTGSGPVTASVVVPGGAPQVSRLALDGTATTRADRPAARSALGAAPGYVTGTTVAVDPAIRLQTVTGFGASLTDSSAYDLSLLPAADRDAVMTRLFDPVRGAGLSLLRQPIGASDLAREIYSYDDMPAGRTDYGLKHFSIAHDEAQILPLLRQAKTLNPDLTVVASPWSPPGWMKTSGSMIDGRLTDTPRTYRAYAAYLVKFLQAYRDAGVDVDYLTVQNEPQALERSDYPGTNLDVAQEAKVIAQLGPAIKKAGLRTKILGFDHNWGVHPWDAGRLEQENGDPEANYPLKLLGTSAARWIAGTAYHCYYGDPAVQSTMKALHPDKEILETECEGLNLTRAMGTLQNWGQSLTAWNLALDENHGPFVGGCKTCTGLVTVDATTKKVTYNERFYLLSAFSSFVRPGAHRVSSTSVNNIDGQTAQVDSVAFRNPDGSTAVVVRNLSSTEPQRFAVREGSTQFTATLPAGAYATYSWDAR
ncbi:glycoside hydrolase family 30 protein [Luteimicrobium subarcticum]|uniref:Glucosylceramidase n=1 Tax=Luteimicrobium subarcticum TaxID=620910 RepID=A0A2M8WRK6_9MICO|nr:glycoside hydrolase family 30 beta sandwich domain-containing protein [Luteimicrobium subarcticum]PJI93577.1 glucosylceramidase [Luteimicrobium subarcticum]